MTYFESPNYPLASETNLGSCTLAILLGRDVKQVLLEFVFFEILPPTDGNCIDDQLMITTESGSKMHEVPIICGIATGQHSKIYFLIIFFNDNRKKKLFSVYIDVRNSQKLFLSILTHTADDRAFSIKVTQLTVHDNLAPDGCLQFFTEAEGTIKTFNYDNDYSQIIKYRNPTYFVSYYHMDSLLCNTDYRKMSLTLELSL